MVSSQEGHPRRFRRRRARSIGPIAAANTLLFVVVLLVFLIKLGATTGACPPSCQCTMEVLNCSRVSKPPGLQQVPLIQKATHPQAFFLLDFTGNSISSIGRKVWKVYPWAEYLILKGNKLSKVENTTLEGLLSLSHLDLSYNRIQTIERFAFEPTPFLQFINLSSNVIDHLTLGAFEAWHGMQFLLKLDLTHNPLTVIQDTYFYKLPSLKFLNLGNTEINPEIVENLLQKSLHLKTLVLSNKMTCCLCRIKDDIEVLSGTVKLDCVVPCTGNISTFCEKDEPLSKMQAKVMKVLEIRKTNATNKLNIMPESQLYKNITTGLVVSKDHPSLGDLTPHLLKSVKELRKLKAAEFLQIKWTDKNELKKLYMLANLLQMALRLKLNEIERNSAKSTAQNETSTQGSTGVTPQQSAANKSTTSEETTVTGNVTAESSAATKSVTMEESAGSKPVSSEEPADKKHVASEESASAKDTETQLQKVRSDILLGSNQQKNERFFSSGRNRRELPGAMNPHLEQLNDVDVLSKARHSGKLEKRESGVSRLRWRREAIQSKAKRSFVNYPTKLPLLTASIMVDNDDSDLTGKVVIILKHANKSEKSEELEQPEQQPETTTAKQEEEETTSGPATTSGSTESTVSTGQRSSFIEEASEEEKAGQKEEKAGQNEEKAGQNEEKAGQNEEKAGQNEEKAGQKEEKAGQKEEKAGQKEEKAGQKEEKAGQKEEKGEQKEEKVEQKEEKVEQKEEKSLEKTPVIPEVSKEELLAALVNQFHSSKESSSASKGPLGDSDTNLNELSPDITLSRDTHWQHHKRTKTTVAPSGKEILPAGDDYLLQGDLFEAELNKKLTSLIPNAPVRGLISHVIRILKMDCAEPRVQLACAKLISRTGLLMKLFSDRENMKESSTLWKSYFWSIQNVANVSTPSTRKLEKPEIASQGIPEYGYGNKLLLAISVTAAVIIIIGVICLIEICSRRSAKDGTPKEKWSFLGRKKKSVEQTPSMASMLDKPLWLKDMYQPLDEIQRRGMVDKLHDEDTSEEDDIFSWAKPPVPPPQPIPISTPPSKKSSSRKSSRTLEMAPVKKSSSKLLAPEQTPSSAPPSVPPPSPPPTTTPTPATDLTTATPSSGPSPPPASSEPEASSAAAGSSAGSAGSEGSKASSTAGSESGGGTESGGD